MSAPSWRDHEDRPVAVAPVPGAHDPAFYIPIGDLQAGDYRRNAFAMGTVEELGALRSIVGLAPGTRVLDVGCGDARHLRALAAAGVHGTGVDVSPGLIGAARDAAAAAGAGVGPDEAGVGPDEAGLGPDAVGVGVDLLIGDARRLPELLGARLGTFDVVWSLCQGGLGTSPATDPDVVRGMAAAVRPGGTVIVTLFHALFAARHLIPGDAFDPVHLVHHQVSEVRGPDHARERFDLWTAAYTVRDAVRLLGDVGLTVDSVRGAQPGAYGRRGAWQVALDDPELLVVARAPEQAG